LDNLQPNNHGKRPRTKWEIILCDRSIHDQYIYCNLYANNPKQKNFIKTSPNNGTNTPIHTIFFNRPLPFINDPTEKGTAKGQQVIDHAFADYFKKHPELNIVEVNQPNLETRGAYILNTIQEYLNNPQIEVIT
jgi:hypothetical protein